MELVTSVNDYEKHMRKIFEGVLKRLKRIPTGSWDMAIVGLIVLMGVMWFSITYFQYERFAFRSGDTSVAEQAIWNTAHGRVFYQSFLQTDTNLREHLNFIQALYVPVYALVPHTLTLFFLIQLAFVAGLLYLYRYAKSKFGVLAGALAAGIFTFNPLTASQVVGDMHVVSVAGPALMYLLVAYHEKKYKQFLFWTLFVVLITEFVAPTVALLGVLALLEGRGWKWFVPPVLGGVAMYTMAKYWITMGFSSNANILSKFTPSAIGSIYKLEKRLDLIREALAPLLWVFPWFSRYAILLVPSLLIALLIIVPGRIGVGNHVFILIPPILSMIFIDLFGKYGKWRRLIFAVACAGILISLYPWVKWMRIDGSDLTREMDEAVAMVKDGGSLTTSGQFGPKLCRREEFFLPVNEKMTDYVVLKTSKIEKNASELEGQELKYDQKIMESGLYREIFRQGRVVVFVKKEKIAQLLHISQEEIEKYSDADLQKKWAMIGK